MSTDFDFTIFAFNKVGEAASAPRALDQSPMFVDPSDDSLPSRIESAEVVPPGTIDREFELLPMASEHAARFSKKPRLICGAGFPSRPTMTPPRQIIADPIPACSDCGQKEVIPGQPGRPYDRCFNCFLQMNVASRN